MAGAIASTKAPPEDDRARLVSRNVRKIFRAASSGQRSLVDSSFEVLEQCVRGVAPFRAEVHELRAAIDPEYPVKVHSDWASGRTSGTWDALGEGAEGDPFAFVYLTPEGDARRIVGSGAGLLPASIERVVSTQRKDARVMRAVAVLALSGGQGLSSSELFRSVYGFDYEDTCHSN